MEKYLKCLQLIWGLGLGYYVFNYFSCLHCRRGILLDCILFLPILHLECQIGTPANLDAPKGDRAVLKTTSFLGNMHLFFKIPFLTYMRFEYKNKRIQQYPLFKLFMYTNPYSTLRYYDDEPFVKT